MTVLKLLISV